jgi:hypothetical protein
MAGDHGDPAGPTTRSAASGAFRAPGADVVGPAPAQRLHDRAAMEGIHKMTPVV